MLYWACMLRVFAQRSVRLAYVHDSHWDTASPSYLHSFHEEEMVLHVLMAMAMCDAIALANSYHVPK